MKSKAGWRKVAESNDPRSASRVMGGADDARSAARYRGETPALWRDKQGKPITPTKPKHPHKPETRARDEAVSVTRASAVGEKVKLRPHHTSGGSAMNPKSLANLTRGFKKGDRHPPKGYPDPTPQDAADYIKLRAAGVPGTAAMAFFIPPGERKAPSQLRVWAGKWDRHPHVAAAWAEWNGSAWQDLAPAERIDHALAHHYAQLAYFLYTTDWNHKEANVAKLNYAREALTAKLDADKGGEGSRFDAFMRELLAGSSKRGIEPPILTKAGIAEEALFPKES